ncbi:uncharacterized protein RJT20DRAFT_17064 [Scheffersomyces xylosifermentans]|uniref:uncharacterized protein n=1 Tax=Scheffersomyces xylosifermentans TaxID=1304137 RepID=UPI00315D66EF
MTEQAITFQVVAESVLKDIVDNIVRQQTLATFANHVSIQQQTKGNHESNVPVISNFEIGSTKDIFGQDKTKLKTSEASRYFSCENCGRKIAGGRFAQHVNKCLERRRR